MGPNLEGPSELLVLKDGISACYWEGPQRVWIKKDAPAELSWRFFLDTPTELDDEVTLGTFIRLFDIPDGDLDEHLFTVFTSIEEGPFRRWIAALSEPGFPSLPAHLVEAEIDCPLFHTTDGRVGMGQPGGLSLVSEGRVDDPFWRDSSRFEWSAFEFPLAQLGDLPLRLAHPRGSEGQEAGGYHFLTFRQIIQAIFYWCPPANRLSDLRPSDRARIDPDDIEPCTRTLEEMLGVAS